MSVNSNKFALLFFTILTIFAQIWILSNLYNYFYLKSFDFSRKESVILLIFVFTIYTILLFAVIQTLKNNVLKHFLSYITIFEGLAIAIIFIRDLNLTP